MKNRQIKYGYNSARDFINRFDQRVDAMSRKQDQSS